MLVPLDGSAFAEHALPLALGLARRAGEPLDLLLVHALYAFADPACAWAPYDPAADAARRRQEQAYLGSVAGRLGALAPVRVTTAVADGLVADAILGRAAAGGAGLLVMTTHCRGALGRAFFGSVADEVVRRSPTPVLLVRPHDLLADLSREPAVRRVLLALDGSAEAEQALKPAVWLSRLTGAELLLLHAVAGPRSPGHAACAGLAVATGRSWEERQAEEALAYLDGLARPLRREGLEVRARVAAGRDAAAVILDEARDQGCDLIALATHGHGGLKRLLLGSVADGVARGAATPVLLCRPAVSS
jgi:nucleotide-binding universal stress UspA family protein